MKLWEIENLITKKYKDGDDWVYAKAKKTEIEIIKSLLDECERLREDNMDLEDKLNTVDPWEAYHAVEYELDRVRNKFENTGRLLHNFSDMKAQWEQAQQKLEESYDYMEKVAKEITELENSESHE